MTLLDPRAELQTLKGGYKLWHYLPSIPAAIVFAIIFLVALAVYFLGGVFYQRTVAHARGWRQLPNYSLWAGIWGFIKVRGLPLVPHAQCEAGSVHSFANTNAMLVFAA